MPPNPTGVCRTYWVDGTCPFGLNCKYKHEVSSATHTTSTATAKDNNPPVQTIKAFPDIASVTTDSCDALLKPSKILRPSAVQAALKEAAEPRKRVDSTAVAENLLLAINAYNKTNELAVSHSRRWLSIVRIVADGIRLLTTDRVYSTLLPR